MRLRLKRTLNIACLFCADRKDGRWRTTQKQAARSANMTDGQKSRTHDAALLSKPQKT
jgi:hypothetical protein